jgi:hypothetical protein
MEDLKIIIIGALSMLVVGIGIWIGASHFEAKAFNELTGSNVSTKQAMFIQLRVIEPHKVLK